MKVVIVGAGLAGLSTAISLRKYVHSRYRELEIKIYDKGDAGSDWAGAQGAALGLQGNGLKALQDIDPELRDKVYKIGFPCTHFTHKADNGWLLGREYLDVLPISRPLLIKCLLESLPKSAVSYKTVSKIVAEQGRKPKVMFEDGSEEIADLVIGADGLRSIVRRSLFGNDEQYRQQYQGLCAVGGILDIALPKHIIDEPSMVFFMGATGVFGYSGLTQTDHRKLLFWSVYQTELPRRDLRLDYDLLTKQLKERHSGWGDPIIQQCLDNATIDNIYPIFIMPDLPHWGRDGCLLIGDAAHALPPRSGQGSSQAFEDANTVGLLLAGLMENHAQEAAIPLLVKGVYDIRHDRVKVIRNQALRFKDPKMPMSLAMKWFLWTSMFIMTKLLYIYKLLGAIDTWDAKEEVKRYLGG